ncbi:MAG TPA: hypothetical protein VLT79_02995 [Gemmatimonadales bacterium]|nr:hypothetical protein [Gemmatimonadales bacterium]
MNQLAGNLTETVAHRLAHFEEGHVTRRIWERDPTVWKPDPRTPELRDRLGWLDAARATRGQLAGWRAFVAEARTAFDRVILCGMGGSSLAPLVLADTFGAASGYPRLTVLDSTDPRAVASVTPATQSELARTLFIISSKSGTTLEPDCFYRYFWERTDGNGAQFAAITDPGTPLARLAQERRFRSVVLAPADVGGRYSALTPFGMVPASLLGLEVTRLLDAAEQAARDCGPDVPASRNPGAQLGAILGEAARAGRNKLTFVLSPRFETLGLWLEQLIAESTGKEGTGVLPVAGEVLGGPEVYGGDRLFAAITLAGEDDRGLAQRLDALERAGHPVLRSSLADPYALGGEFFRWEFATAVAGAVLGINPFDQPNVAESKANTDRVLAEKTAAPSAAGAHELAAFWDGIQPGDYLALMAYLPPNQENDRTLAGIQQRLRDRFRVATTLGYGPRFLHSTGQLHKGGPATGHFLQITERPARDLAIPGKPFTFGQLELAQAEGDLQALRKRGRPAVRVNGLGLLGS